jgi:cell pole-organizing protein PopZ
LQQEYADKYGIVLSPGDFKVSVSEEELRTGTYAKGDVQLNDKKAIGKLRESEGWKQSILETYGVDVNAESDNDALVKKLNKAYSVMRSNVADYKAQLAAAYARNKETGDAFVMQQPPPPSLPDAPLWPKKSFGGQRKSTTIKRQNFAGEEGEKIEQYGFDSIVEAVSYLNAKQFQGAPIGDLPDTTSADLRAAREAKQARDAANPLAVSPRRRTKTAPAAPSTVTPPINNVPDEKKEAPLEVPEIAFKDVPNFDNNDIDVEGFGAIANSSLLNMIKLAADLDSKGRTREAKEIHTILKKHIPL